jgi:hypothetical protein
MGNQGEGKKKGTKKKWKREMRRGQEEEEEKKAISNIKKNEQTSYFKTWRPRDK